MPLQLRSLVFCLLVLLFLAGAPVWAQAEEQEPPHPSTYTTFTLDPPVVEEPVGEGAVQRTTLHVEVGDSAPPAAANRPTIYGQWSVRVGAVGQVTIGSSCTVVNTDLVFANATGRFVLQPGNGLLLDLIPLTVCGDAFVEEDEFFEVALTLSLAQNLSDPFHAVLRGAVVDKTVVAAPPDAPPPHPSTYTTFALDPRIIVEPVGEGAVQPTTLHVEVGDSAAPVCVTTTEGDVSQTVCTPVSNNRPTIYGEWSVRLGASGQATIGSSCSVVPTDLVFENRTGTFVLLTGNELLLDLIPVTVCGDAFVEDDEAFEVALTLSLFQDLSQPFHAVLRGAVVDSTVLKGSPLVFGGHSAAHPRLSFLEDDAGDPCRPIELLVALTVPDLEEDTVLVFGYDLFSGSAELDKDFRFTPPPVAVIPLGDPGARFVVGCIIGDDIPEPLELFNIWVQIMGSAVSRIYVTVEIVDDEVRSHVPGFLTFEVGGGRSGPYPEGDEEGVGLPIVLRYSDRQVRSEALSFRITTVDGTAIAGEDYHPIDRTFTFAPGHIGLFDLGDQVRLRLIPDLVPEEIEEQFYVAVYASLGDDQELYFSDLLPIGIQDDDFIAGLFEDQQAWFGVDPAGCPNRAVLDLPEPPPGAAPFLDYTVDLFARLLVPEGGAAGGGEVVCSPPAETFSVEATLETGGLSADPPAVVGDDLSFAVRFPERLVFRPLEQSTYVVVRVYADERIEADEFATLRLFLGVHGSVTLRLRVVDFQKGEELVAGRNASFVRLGRMMGSMVSDGLQDRFSCARAKGCRTDTPASGSMRSGLRRVLSAFAPVAPIAHNTGMGGSPSAALAAGTHMGAGFGPVDPNRGLMDVVGPRLDGLRFQGSPSGWFAPRNQSRGTSWSTWLRSDYLYTSDASSDGSVQRASMLGLYGGLDKQFRLTTIGTLYGWAWADYSRRFRPDLAAAEQSPRSDRAFSNAASWQFLAPYVAVHPHELVRGWTSFGRTIASTWSPSLGYQSDQERVAGAPAYSFVVGGGSVTAFKMSGLVIDVEADAFSVAASFRTCSTDCIRRAENVLAFLVDAESGTPATSFNTPETGATLAQVVGEGYDIGLQQVKLDPAVRRRISIRAGIPFAAGGVGNLAVVISRRWDTGQDIEWLLGHAGGVHAYDLGFDLRFSRPGSRLAAAASGRVEVRGSSAIRDRGLLHRERSVAGSLRWGSVETASGWAVTIRPRYGYPGALGSLQQGTMAELIPSLLGGASPAPFVDVDAGYGFEDGSRVVLTGSRGLGASHSYGSGLAAGLNYQRGW